MLNLNGYRYSRESFDDYKFRALFKFQIKDQFYTSNINVYTDNPDKNVVIEVVDSRRKENVLSSKLLNWCSKEQDDLHTEFLNETLENI